MKLNELISIIEYGSYISVYDSSVDTVVFNGYVTNETMQLLYVYHTYKVVSINTDCMVNFEIVINNVL